MKTVMSQAAAGASGAVGPTSQARASVSADLASDESERAAILEVELSTLKVGDWFIHCWRERAWNV